MTSHEWLFEICTPSVPYLNDTGMLKERRVAHESDVVYLQFKLLSTHVGFGGQDGGQDAVGEPSTGKRRLNEKDLQQAAWHRHKSGEIKS